MRVCLVIKARLYRGFVNEKYFFYFVCFWVSIVFQSVACLWSFWNYRPIYCFCQGFPNSRQCFVIVFLIVTTHRFWIYTNQRHIVLGALSYLFLICPLWYRFLAVPACARLRPIWLFSGEISSSQARLEALLWNRRKLLRSQASKRSCARTLFEKRGRGAANKTPVLNFATLVTASRTVY